MTGVHCLPILNASLNALAAVFLVMGWSAIKSQNRKRHRHCMIAALCCSVLFLTSYLTYHILVPGVTRYQGEGIDRILYFAILLTHTPLAAIIVPFCCLAVWHVLRQDFVKHTRITRWLLPVWLYVSITGVLIYFMLYVL
jgi:putative membrane protein